MDREEPVTLHDALETPVTTAAPEAGRIELDGGGETPCAVGSEHQRL
jgi:hypothetical protein